MSCCPFDIHALPGRSFGDVLDEIAPGWRPWGLGETGLFAGPIGGFSPLSEETIRRNAEIRCKVALIVEALREGTVDVITIDGVVPRQVWFEGGWGVYYDGERRVIWLQAPTEAGPKVRRYSPRFAMPAASSDKRGPRGNTRYDDTVAIERAKAVLKTMAKPSKQGAAEQAIGQLIAEGRAVDGPSQGAWIKRVRQLL